MQLGRAGAIAAGGTDACTESNKVVIRGFRRGANDVNDEISYVRRNDFGYRAFGTPFAGELARPGANVSAPIQRVCLLKQSSQNRLLPVGRTQAVRALMRHILFFAKDNELVERVLDSVVRFASNVEVVKMEFTRDGRGWDLIQ